MPKGCGMQKGQKGQSDIISAVIIIVIAIGLVATAYTWGLPLIQKRQDSALANRAFNYFNEDNMNSLVKKIESIARNSGEDTFSIDVNGIWTLYPCRDADIGVRGCMSGYDIENNSIHFSLYSRVSNIGINQGWITLSSTEACPAGKTIIGSDPYVVCARADSYAGGYNITYRVQFRELEESPQEGMNLTRGFKIVLIPAINLTRSTGNLVRITRGDVYSQDVGGNKTLIITEVKILLG
jgi:hypothetical protein